MPPLLKRLMLFGLVALVGAQLIRVDRTNPPVEMNVPASASVDAVLRRACYDCHSNETVWPWYSNVAPVSWLVARDVREGRDHLNFSTWNRLSSDAQARAVREVWTQVSNGEMPMAIYLPLHSEARLSDLDKRVLRTWAESVGPGPGMAHGRQDRGGAQE